MHPFSYKWNLSFFVENFWRWEGNLRKERGRGVKMTKMGSVCLSIIYLIWVPPNECSVTYHKHTQIFKNYIFHQPLSHSLSAEVLLLEGSNLSPWSLKGNNSTHTSHWISTSIWQSTDTYTWETAWEAIYLPWIPSFPTPAHHFCLLLVDAGILNNRPDSLLTNPCKLPRSAQSEETTLRTCGFTCIPAPWRGSEHSTQQPWRSTTVPGGHWH